MKNNILIILCLTALAWSNVITGYIKDSSTLEPISNVNIFIKKINLGTTSNSEGFFQIEIIDNQNLDLIISHIGYKKKIVSIDLLNDKSIIVLLEETFYKINDIVVTATQTPKILKDVPISTEVINKNEIYNSNVENLGELLDLRSGVSTASSVQGENTISIMGMDSKYMLILIDGQPIVGKFNSRTSLEQIATYNIEKVEIIKGPSSSLYGSEAMGGVINVITNTKLSNEHMISLKYNGTDGKFFPLNSTIGTRILNFKYKNQIKKINYTIGSMIKQINVDEKNIYSNLDNIKRVNFDTQLSFNHNSKHNIKLINTYFYNLEVNKSLARSNNILINRTSSNLIHNWLYSDQLKINQFFRFGNYTRNKEYLKMDGNLDSINKTKENEIEYEISGIYSNNDIIINFGSEIIKSNYIGDRINNYKQSTTLTSLYSQIDFSHYENWDFVLGLRSDKHSNIKIVYSPRIATMYTLNEKWKFRAIWGKGFRMPSSQEKFFEWFNDLGGGSGYKVIGNPNLKPETSHGYSLGFDYFHSNIYRVSLMFYRTNFNNMIKDTNIPKNNCSSDDIIWDYGCLSYENIDRVKYTGVELQGSFNISNDWKTEWSLNWIDNIDLSNNTSLPNTQNLSSKINFTHKLANLPFKYSIQIKWIAPYYPMEYDPINNDYKISDRKRKSQYFINYSSSWNILGPFTLESGIKNITDQTDTTYGPFIGRTYFLTIKYKNHE